MNPDSNRKSSEARQSVGSNKQDESSGDPSAALTAYDRQYAALQNVPQRIHIVGMGSIGKLIAHSLASLPNAPPVTLIFHRRKVLEAWLRSKKQITLEDGDAERVQGGFNAELMPEQRRQHGVEIDDSIADAYPDAKSVATPRAQGNADVYSIADSLELKPHIVAHQISQLRQQDEASHNGEHDDVLDSPTNQSMAPGPIESSERIHTLIIATKAFTTLAALSALRPRLSRDSTICFLQNGVGVVDEINRRVFPNVEDRPTYIQGVVTHGVNAHSEKAIRDPFRVVHAGHGTISLAILPHGRSKVTHDSENSSEISDNQSSSTARQLIRALTRSPVLGAVALTPLELYQQQLEKLAVNSIINPLTSLMDNYNGSVLYNFALTRTMRLLLAETSLVLRSLPELHGIPNIHQRFAPERLEALVVRVALATKDNISSMLSDIRAGRRTEIDYINGYVIQKGEELGISCVVNYAIMHAVIGKAKMVQREWADTVPLLARRSQE